MAIRGGRRRICIVVGTRPEVIKMVPVVRALRADPELDVRLVATAQHRGLADQALAAFGLMADVDLDLMRPGQGLSDFAGRCLAALGDYLARERPDYVLAQGDTTTVLCAALAACHAGIAFGHVEAGLRSGDAANPFPEEMNRTLVAQLARHHFCPTDRARRNLLDERIDAAAIHVTGNTAIDTLLATAAAIPAATGGERRVLVTLHRRENIAHLAAVIAAVRAIVARYPDVRIDWPLHPNPAIGPVVRAALAGHPAIRLHPPLAYAAFVGAMRAAHLILTDSGGVQEEAPALGTPVLVLRTATERPEGIEAGVTRLAGISTDGIVAATAALLDDPAAHAEMARGASPYGDGHAAGRIARVVRDYVDTLPMV